MAAAGTVSSNAAGAVIAVAHPLVVCLWPRYWGTLAPSSTNVYREECNDARARA